MRRQDRAGYISLHRQKWPEDPHPHYKIVLDKLAQTAPIGKVVKTPPQLRNTPMGLVRNLLLHEMEVHHN